MTRQVEGRSDDRRLGRASALAGAGDGVVAVALPLLAVGVSRDPLVVAGVVAAQHLPWAALAVVGPGVIGPADQRTVLGLAATLRAATVAVLGLLALAGAETMVMVVAGAVLLGLGEALADAAEDAVAAAPTIGAGLSRSGMAGLAGVGLPLGGVLFALASGVPFVVAMGLFALGALTALTLPRRVVGRRAAPPGPESPVAIVPLVPGTAGVTGVAAASSGAGGGVLGVLVLFSVEDLGLGAPAFGLLSIGLALAAALGAALAPSVGQLLGVRGGATLALATSGAGYVGAGMVADPGRPFPAVLALAGAVAAGMAAAVLLRAGLHMAVPHGSTDQAVAAFHVRVWAAVPAGAVAGGVVARSLGVGTALGVAGGVLVVVAMVAAGVAAPASRSVPQKSG